MLVLVTWSIEVASDGGGLFQGGVEEGVLRATGQLEVWGQGWKSDGPWHVEVLLLWRAFL